MRAVKASSAIPWVLVLDAALVFSNLFLAGRLTREMGATLRAAWGADDPVAGRTLGLALLATFVAHAVGAWFKRRPMHARLAAERAREEADGEPVAGPGTRRRRDAPRARLVGRMSLAQKWPQLRAGMAVRRHSTLIVCLLFLHCVLSMLVLASVGALLDVRADDWRFCLYFAAIFVPTLLFARALVPPRAPARAGWLAHPLVEALANACLFSYALINQLFWGALMDGHEAAPLTSLGGTAWWRLFAVYVFVVPATLMYLFAPRVLFLAEELEDPRTRLSMKIAVLSVALRWLAGPDFWGGMWRG